MAPQPAPAAPASAGGTPGNEPAPASASGTPGTAPARPARRMPPGRPVIVLVDWWLKRAEGEEGRICLAGITRTPQPWKGAATSTGNRIGGAGRLMTSAPIARRLDATTFETLDGKLIRVVRIMNYSRTLENGFSHEVCKSFQFGFPSGWEKIVNRNMERIDEHMPVNASSASVEYYMNQLVNGSSADAMRYAYGGNDLYSSKGSTSNTNGPSIQRCWNVSNGNTSNHPPGSSSERAASKGLGYALMDIPEEPLTPPRKTCNSGQADSQHESMQLNTSRQEMGSFKQRTGEICSDSKLDGNRSASSKIASVEKESYRKRAGFDLSEQDADIKQECMHSCSSEQPIASHPADSTLVQSYMSCTSPDLGEREAPNCGNLAIVVVDAVEASLELLTPQNVRRLRSGKAFGMPCSAPAGRGNKRKRIQHEASNKNTAPNAKGRVVGRPRKERIKGSLEPGASKTSKGSAHQCTICKQYGHHRQTCKDGVPEEKKALAQIAAKRKAEKAQRKRLAAAEKALCFESGSRKKRTRTSTKSTDSSKLPASTSVSNTVEEPSPQLLAILSPRAEESPQVLAILPPPTEESPQQLAILPPPTEDSSQQVMVAATAGSKTKNTRPREQQHKRQKATTNKQAAAKPPTTVNSTPTRKKSIPGGRGNKQKRMSCTSPDLGEREAPNCGNLAIVVVDAVEAPLEGLTPQYGENKGSKDSTVRRLRSGKAFGMRCSAPRGRGNK